MKIPISHHSAPFKICDLRFAIGKKSSALARCGASPRPNRQSSIGNRQSRAFTLMEIAISMAIIGFAVVAIIGVLPFGMRAQRNNAEETVINQDATVLLESIRNGVRSRYTCDLTNYVYAITNRWTRYNANGSTNMGTDWYTHSDGYWRSASAPALTNDANIIGVLSTPEFIGNNADDAGLAIPCVHFGGYSNYITAYVRSISGLAVEKPPQNNDLMRENTFSYQVICVNAPLPADTNLFFPRDNIWTDKNYNPDEQVLWRWFFWRAITNIAQSNPPNIPREVPGESIYWAKVPSYPLEQLANTRELRLRFRWPQRPNGDIGIGSQNFRLTISGQLTQDAASTVNTNLYFYQPQTFTATP